MWLVVEEYEVVIVHRYNTKEEAYKKLDDILYLIKQDAEHGGYYLDETCAVTVCEVVERFELRETGTYEFAHGKYEAGEPYYDMVSTYGKKQP